MQEGAAGLNNRNDDEQFTKKFQTQEYSVPGSTRNSLQEADDDSDDH